MNSQPDGFLTEGHPYQTTEWSADRQPLLEQVGVEALPDHSGRFIFPSELRQGVMLDVIHDGAYIPKDFLKDWRGGAIDPEIFDSHYVLERDWGASIVADRVAARLGLDSYYKVNVARVLMDFGRFPGSTTGGAGHLDRFAINYPFSELLGHDQKKRLLEHYYDRISAGYEAAVRDHFVKIAVHTYDKYNASGTVRPQVSIVTRSDAYQTNHRLPVGTFDPMFPDILVEFCADRILRDRISLTLESSGIPVEHNYPYALPEGSIEVRAQVWFFFVFLREQFQEAFPESAEDPAYQQVWSMLLDTNLRSSESASLRSFIHLFRRPPRTKGKLYRAARDAYFHIREFLDRDGQAVVESYRFSPTRPSTLGIEVRKDLVWEFDTDNRPVRPRFDNAWRIADTIAEAVAIYLRYDRRAHETPPLGTEFRRQAPWPSADDPAGI